MEKFLQKRWRKAHFLVRMHRMKRPNPLGVKLHVRAEQSHVCSSHGTKGNVLFRKRNYL